MHLPGVQLASSASSDEVTVDYGVVTTGKYDAPSSISEGIKIAKGAKDFAQSFFFEVAQHKNFQRELDGLAAKVAF